MKNSSLKKSIHIVGISGGISACSLLPYLTITDNLFEQCVICFCMIFMVLPSLITTFLTGEHRFFIDHHNRIPRICMYIWAFLGFVMISLIVAWTGGVQDSPVVWVFELSMITALCLNAYSKPKKLRNIFANCMQQNRLILLTLVASIVSVILIGREGHMTIKPYNWLYTSMTCYTLIASIILFYLSDENWRREGQKEKAKNSSVENSKNGAL